MLPKLLLPAVIVVLLLTNNASVSANSITSTSASAATTTTTAAVSSKILHGAAATTTTSLLPLQPPPINVTSSTTSSLVPAQTEHSISDNVTVTSDSLLSGSTTEKKLKRKLLQQQQQEQSNPAINKQLLFGYFIGRSNDSSFQQRNEFQNAGKTEGSYRVQLPNGAAQTQVEYKADSTGYYPVVRYESNTNGSSVSGPFALGQSSVSELPLSGKAPQLPVNSQGYIQFELNYDDAAAQVPADQQRSAPRTEKVGQVLTNLFPNGFSDIFRFSYASEQSTTASTASTAGHSNTTPTPTTSAAATTSNAAKTAENQTYYSYATTVSKEYRREIKPGHTEIVVEQMNKAPHTSSEEFKDGSNGITKDELLRINRAAVDASVLPSLLMEPTKLNATKAQVAAAANAPIVILNEDSVELEQTDGEDNQIAESKYVAQHVYQRLPDYEYEGLHKANSDLSGLEQQINVQIIHDDTLKTLQNEALAKQLFTPAAELQPERSVAFPAEASTASYELDRFQEHAEQNFQQRNLLQEAPSRKFLKNFNPKLSEGDGEPVQKGNFHYESSTPRPLVDPPTPISEAQQGGYAGEYVKPAAQLEYQRTLEQQQKEQQHKQQLKEQQHQQQQYLQQRQYLTQQHEQQQQKQQKQQLAQGPQQFVHYQAHDQQQSQSQFPHQQSQQQHSQPPQAHATSSLNTHIHDSNPSPDYEGYKSTAASAQGSSGSNNLVFVTVSTPAPQTSPSPSAPTTKIGKTPHEFVSEAAAASQTISKKVPRPNLGYTFVEVQKSVNIHNKLIKEQNGKVLEQHETTYHQPQYAVLQEQQPKQQKQQQEEKEQQQGGQQHYQFQQHQGQHGYQYQKPTQQYQQQAYQYQQQAQQQQQQQGYQYQTPTQQYQISYQQHYQPQQQYQPTDYQQQKYEPSYEKQPGQFSTKDFVSLAANPIHVQHLDYESEQQQQAASHDSVQNVPLPQAQLQPPAPDAATELQAAGSQRQEHLHAEHEGHEEQQQPTVQYIKQYVPQPYPVQVEKIVERPYPVTQVVEQKVPAPYPVQEIVEKIVEHPVAVEKVVGRPVKVPYPVHVDRYIDRPYPVHEIVEKHIGIPYAVPEPVPVAVPVDHYIDRPYPVETIVEKRVPYPVEKIVEKVVEKHVPVEVERIVEKIVEKPVERLVHRYVDRPVPMPIHVPVAVPMSFQHAHAYGPEPLYPPTTQSGAHHPNALSWSQVAAYQIPPKVLQNYYARMLKKMLPHVGGHKSFTAGITQAQAVSKAPVLPTPPPPPAHKAGDIRFDLQPPPPLNSNWAKGARYIYNTLPQDLSASASVALAYQLPLNNGQAAPSTVSKSNDAFERWRHGHTLKRSPDFGRNLHMEYGFKPPLVPSVEIDDHGMPLAKSQTGE